MEDKSRKLDCKLPEIKVVDKLDFSLITAAPMDSKSIVARSPLDCDCEECKTERAIHHDYNPNGYHAGVALCMCGCRGTMYECKAKGDKSL